jgi:tetratricopeptide (TPR) repeat protein
VEEIRGLTESGVPSSMYEALELVRGRGLGSGEFGRIMIAVNVTLLQRLYGAPRNSLPAANPPSSHGYTRILRDAERGVYTAPPPNSRDYLEYVLPFLALLSETRAERLENALPDLRMARELNPGSALAPWFLGILLERAGDPAGAAEEYRRAWEISPECYPAALGLARALDAGGQGEESFAFLLDLAARNPGNNAVERQLALAYYRRRDWKAAEALVTEVLSRDSRDLELILARAHILVEQGQLLQAQAPLDQYAPLGPGNPLYLYLRARVQAEGYRNREAALGFIRSLILAPAAPEEALSYAARFLMESPRREDQEEGRVLLRRLLLSEAPSTAVLSLALQDAVRREDWREGRAYAGRLLEKRRSPGDLFSAYLAERGLGNHPAALGYARELYEQSPANDEWAAAYVSALIDSGRREEAGRMIESRLAAVAGGALKGRYYYLRSRLKSDEEAVMGDLRSSLFEDPRNLDALIALFEIYHRRREERRAVYYLKQALAIAPDNPLLRRYETEYAALLGSSF